ncbi:MAG: galactose-1-phosphate uridylyltransferase [Candidatus Diapherotrites archaeon]|uniref:Galactose-1-phosphate uridylyltransferase n=1 Tax=Candidatus Iainarchaeum sp. TaxID=3101447 RepID=A0A938YXQ1_9ARCH|nr:galactose-1-phosphate uridylyltransferase [Candidatus Diapherotrites archaeon]
MHELRKDYIFSRWVIVNTERAKRPKDFIKQHPKINESGPCPFCPGNESLTPPEIARISDGKGWQIRVFPNKFPAVTLKGSSDLKTRDSYFTSGDAFGQHEVIVETPNHREKFTGLSVERIAQLLQMFATRIEALYKIPGIKYVSVFKNHGLEAGTSLSHEHTQIIAYNKLPNNVLREVKAIEAHYRKHRKCPYCEVIEIEKKGPRRIAENKSFFAFTPYASIFEFEAGIFPKRHVARLSKLDEEEMRDLAELIKKVVGKLSELDAPYNMYLHEAPPGRKHHLHVKIVPRLITWGGFEHCTGCIINTVSPEQAAEFYRSEAKG